MFDVSVKNGEGRMMARNTSIAKKEHVKKLMWKAPPRDVDDDDDQEWGGRMMARNTSIAKKEHDKRLMWKAPSR